jgi:hypothetical protein
MPTPSYSPSPSRRYPARDSAFRPSKSVDSPLLIIECDTPTLAADRLDLGSAFKRLLNHDLVKPMLPNMTVELLQTSTSGDLLDQFAQVSAKRSNFRAVLIVGHSNPDGLQFTRDAFCDWTTVGKWLEPFGPEFLFLAACEAGRSEAVRKLFGPLHRSLRDIYASPAKLSGVQAAALAVVIGELLLTGEIDDKNSTAARIVNYFATGGQLYRWSYDETGCGSEIPPQSWDKLASALDFGPWDLQQFLADILKGRDCP